MIFNKRPRPRMMAIARLTNPFMYTAETFETGPGGSMVRLDEYMNAMAREGWKLHTIDRLSERSYFCVWEKLDYNSQAKS